jgi:glc operon protein GlcG
MAVPTLDQAPTLTAAGARLLIDSAVADARDRNLAITVAVADPGGALLGLLRMDGAVPISVEVAIGKARAAAMIGAPSRIFEEMINSGRPAMLSAPGLVPLRGGVPILLDGRVCGAVGISGAAGDADEAVATGAAAAFVPAQR